MIDGVDRTILMMLQANSRVSNAEIARQVEMAPSAVLERIRKLEERGVIKAYAAQLDPQALGQGLLAYVLVRTECGSWQAETAAKIAAIPEVQEVHHIAGEDCFLVKVRTRDTAALGSLLRDRVSAIECVRSTRTTIVLNTVKETTVINLNEAVKAENVA
jgi:Lrp/AsnC family transcriptional regulator, leucine-responsive regulatory protein